MGKKSSLGNHGGNAHRRAIEKLAHARTTISTPTEDAHPEMCAAQPSTKSLNTDHFLAIISILVGVVLAFVGFVEVFPLYVNLAVYIAGIAIILYGLDRWEKTQEWKARMKMGLLALILAIYCALLYFPVKKQYERENDARITFKDSPLFTEWRKQVIRHDISQFKSFLNELDIDTPSAVPPFGIQTGSSAGQIGSVTPAGLPVNRSELLIGESHIKERESATLVYSDYVMDKLAEKALRNIPWPIPNDRVTELALVSMATQGFARYFNFSFWGSQPDTAFFPPAEIMWEMRKEMGRSFSDRLAASAVRTIADDNETIKDNDLDIYLVHALMIGDSIIDNECERWPEIRSLLVRAGIPEEKVRRPFAPPSMSNSCIQKWSR